MVAIVNELHSRQDPGISTYDLQQSSSSGRALLFIVNTFSDTDTSLSFDGTSLTPIATEDDTGGTSGTKSELYALFDADLPASAGTYGLVTKNWLYNHVAVFELSGSPQVSTGFVTGLYSGLKPWSVSVSAEVGSLHLMSLFANTISTKAVDNAGSTKVVDPTELSGRGVALYHVVTDGAAEDVGFSQEFGDAAGGMFYVTIPVVAETLSFTPTPARPKLSTGYPWLLFGDELWLEPAKAKSSLRLKAPGWQMSPAGFMANVVDPDNDPLSFEITQEPTNADLITGFAGVAIVTPDDDLSQTSDFWFRPWSDGKPGLSEYQVQITYDTFQVAPIFTSTPTLVTNDGVNYQYNITCTDENGDPLTITAPTLPSWATLVDNGNGTGLLSGIPTSEAETDYAVTLNVYDGLLHGQQSFTIVVNRPPVITSVDTISSDTISVDQHQLTATGDAPIVFSLEGTIPSGVTIDGAGLITIQVLVAGTYSLTARATDVNGLFTDQIIGLSVNGVSLETSPVITLNPVDESLAEGVGSITFSASATGNPSPTVQWQKDTQGNGTFANISGATNTSLVVNGSAVTVAGNNGDQYRAVFTNTVGQITTTTATLTVTAVVVAPAIVTHPTNQALNEGSGSVTFAVAYTGTAPITVQWQKDNKGNGSFSNVASPTVNGSSVTEAANDGDQYRVILTNTEGSVISNPAILSVTLVPVVEERLVIDDPGFYVGAIRNPRDNEEEVFTGYQNESEIRIIESGEDFDITSMTRFQIIVNSIVVLDSDDDSSLVWGSDLPQSLLVETNLLLAKLGDAALSEGKHYAHIIAWVGQDRYVITKERRLVMIVKPIT